jgi:Sec-independent protein translocase protein TatA
MTPGLPRRSRYRPLGREYHPGVDGLVILIVILVIVLLIRGPKTLPELGAILGRGVRGAREEASRMRSRDGAPEDPPPPTT